MEIEALIAGVMGAIVALAEFLKLIAGKLLPDWDLDPKVLQLVSGVLVFAVVLFYIKPEMEGLTGALLFSFLSSSGLYGWAVKPLKAILTHLKDLFGK